MGTIHGQGHFRFRIPNFWCRRAYRLVVLRTLRRSLTLDRRTPRCPRGEYDDTKGVILAQLAKVSGQTKRENDMPYSCLIIEKYHQSRHIYDVSKQSVHLKDFEHASQSWQLPVTRNFDNNHTWANYTVPSTTPVASWDSNEAKTHAWPDLPADGKSWEYTVEEP